MTKEQVALVQQQALEAFRQNLPQLWSERPGQWVAYQGSRLLGFATQKHELYQRCLRDGLQLDEFVVFCIEPLETEIFLRREATKKIPKEGLSEGEAFIG